MNPAQALLMRQAQKIVLLRTRADHPVHDIAEHRWYAAMGPGPRWQLRMRTLVRDFIYPAGAEQWFPA